MLVVVVVLGLLVVGLVQGVRVGVALLGAQQRRIGETADLDAGARTLRALLNGVVASPAGEPAGNSGLKGDAEHLSFVGDMPTGRGTSRRADVSLALRGGNLVLSWIPHRHEIPLETAPPPSDTVLVAHVAHLEIAYWGALAPGQPAAWLDRWNGPAAPELIRIRLVFGKDDRRHWPDLIVAPSPAA